MVTKMTKAKERQLIYQMIDALQTDIRQYPKGKIYKEEELHELYQDLRDLDLSDPEILNMKGETRNGL